MINVQYSIVSCSQKEELSDGPATQRPRPCSHHRRYAPDRGCAHSMCETSCSGKCLPGIPAEHFTKQPLVPIPDELKGDVLKGLNEVWLPYRMGQLERALEKFGGPYFCGARMTICDLEFYVARLHGRGTRSIVNIDTRYSLAK